MFKIVYNDVCAYGVFKGFFLGTFEKHLNRADEKVYADEVSQDLSAYRIACLLVPCPSHKKL